MGRGTSHKKWHTKHINRWLCFHRYEINMWNILQIVIHIILCYVKKHFLSSVLILCPISLTEWHLNLVFWEMEQNFVFYIFSMPCKSPCFKLESPKHFIFQIWWSELYIVFLITFYHITYSFKICNIGSHFSNDPCMNVWLFHSDHTLSLLFTKIGLLTMIHYLFPV